jgi:hypothetical protein
MYSGSDSYVGGVKISDSRDLDVDWRRPDEYGGPCATRPSQRKGPQKKFERRTRLNTSATPFL